jgi:hypothetical protein
MTYFYKLIHDAHHEPEYRLAPGLMISAFGLDCMIKDKTIAKGSIIRYGGRNYIIVSNGRGGLTKTEYHDECHG